MSLVIQNNVLYQRIDVTKGYYFCISHVFIIIAGGGGVLQNGKIVSLNFVVPHPPQDRVKPFAPPFQRVETFCAPLQYT